MTRRLLLLALLASLCACSQRPPAPVTPTVAPAPSSTPIAVRPQAEWTLLFYFAADNDLEAEEMGDLEELTQVDGAGESVRLVALVDRSPLGEPSEGYTNRAVANMPNWDHARLLEIQPDKLIPLENWGKSNLADPVPLQRLLQVGKKNFPARRYALFVVDHGHSWIGICSDDSASQPEDCLQLRELADTLQTSGLHLDLLGLDACQMSSLEVLHKLAPSTDFVLASQDSLPAGGLDYRSALQQLAERPQQDGRELGHAFLEGYRASLAADPAENARMQLALLSTAAVPELTHAFASLSRKLQSATRANWLSVARLRSETLALGGEPHELQALQMHDLGQLLQNCRKAFPALTAEAGEAQRLLETVTVEQVTGKFRRQCSGVSLFFPNEREQLHEIPGHDYVATAGEALKGWSDFLTVYTGLEREKKPRPELSDVALRPEGARIHLQARLGNLRQVSDAFTILAQDGFVVGQMPCEREPDSTYLRDYYDGRWLCLQEAGAAAFVPAHLGRIEALAPQLREALVSAPCQLRRNGTRNWLNIKLYFALPLSDPGRPARLAGATRVTNLGQKEIALQPEDEVHFLEPSLHPGKAGRAGPGLILRQPDQLTLTSRPMPPGDYDLGFRVRDVRGEYHWKTRSLVWQE